MPDCASRPASRTSITGPHAASTALCSAAKIEVLWRQAFSQNRKEVGALD
jgi:hypothetical protein